MLLLMHIQDVMIAVQMGGQQDQSFSILPLESKSVHVYQTQLGVLSLNILILSSINALNAALNFQIAQPVI